MFRICRIGFQSNSYVSNMILEYWQYQMYVSNILIFVSKCRWCFQTTMFPMYVSIYIEPQKLYCCRYFENYCILLGQLGHLGGAIFMPFMINFWWSCPTNFKNEFSKNFVFTWFSSPKMAHKKIPTENYRKFSLISMLFYGQIFLIKFCLIRYINMNEPGWFSGPGIPDGFISSFLIMNVLFAGNR